MRAPAVLLLVVAAGCTEPSVSLTIQPPADQADYDTSCVTTFEIYADGKDYPANSTDFASVTVKVATPAATYAELLAEMRGKFDIPIPPSGLGGVEVYAWNGDSGFNTSNVTPELVFYSLASGSGGGGDNFTVPLVPNMSCAKSAVTVRALDIEKFLASSPRNCAAGAEATGAFTMGTLTPAFAADDTTFWGGEENGTTDATSATATIQAATKVGPNACLAVSGGDLNADNNTALGCVSTGAGVCGHQGELEVGTFTNTLYSNSVDNSLLATYHGVVLGAVFDTTRASVAGATVDVDPAKAKVVYVDLDAPNHTLKTIANGTATSASGLFLLYTNELLDVTVSGNGGKSATVRMGTINSYAAVSTIVL